MFIAIEWTSANFHAWLLDAAGQVTDERKSARGVNTIRDGAFAAALREEVGDWLDQATAIMLSGMVTSRTGWVESPFAPAPAGLDEIFASALVQTHDGLPPLYFLPGVSQQSPLPDVMRGEELSLLGTDAPADGLFILPGAHTKWVRKEAGRIAAITTYLSGEILSLLKKDSIISRLMPADYTPHPGAFRRGVAMVDDADIGGGLLRRVFSARSLVLFDQLQPAEIADYLAGMFIAAEIREAAGAVDGPVLLVGNAQVATSYEMALSELRIPCRRIQLDSAQAFSALAVRIAKSKSVSR